MSAGSDFREAYEAEFEPESPGDAVVLDRLCSFLDAIEAMERRIEADGLVVTGGNGQPTVHPLIASVRAHTAEVARLVRQLDMVEEKPATIRGRKAANARWGRGAA